MGNYRFDLRQESNLFHGVSGSKIDLSLTLFHTGYILMERYIVAFIRRSKEENILKHIFIGAIAGVDPPFELCTEGLKELLVFLAFVFQHLFQLAGNFLFKRLGNDAKLTILLQHLT